MKTKTKIDKQSKRKSNSDLVQTILLCKKNKAWLEVAGILATTRKNKVAVNLSQIKEDCVIPGKVLSVGEVKKAKVVAFNFSEKAKEKILKAGGTVVYMADEIKKNKEMKGLKLLK